MAKYDNPLSKKNVLESAKEWQCSVCGGKTGPVWIQRLGEYQLLCLEEACSGHRYTSLQRRRGISKIIVSSQELKLEN